MHKERGDRGKYRGVVRYRSDRERQIDRSAERERGDRDRQIERSAEREREVIEIGK